ncbi:hypothetical protein MGWOODY_Smn2599 [hydrothermal vent metagenome]|uniref:Uncharacterized protein n=1 Tax=hydrothermal vent metagenome TaxID=652676 RepID=A0A160TP84_9ZZZZ
MVRHGGDSWTGWRHFASPPRSKRSRPISVSPAAGRSCNNALYPLRRNPWQKVRDIWGSGSHGFAVTIGLKRRDALHRGQGGGAH